MFLCSTFTLTVGVFWYWNIYLYPPSQPISNILSFSVGNLIRVHVAYITNIDGQFIVTIKIINTVPQNHRNTESQKHNGWGWKAPLEDILYSLSDKAGSRTGSCPAERLQNSSGNLCKCFTVEKCLLILDGIFCVSICAPFCPLMGHHWKKPGSVFFTPSLQIFTCNEQITLSLLQAEQSLFSQPFTRGVSPAPKSPLWPFFWTHSSSSEVETIRQV